MPAYRPAFWRLGKKIRRANPRTESRKRETVNPEELKHRAENLVTRAMDLDPDSWQAFLDEECAEDPSGELRRQVEKLLAETPASQATVTFSGSKKEKQPENRPEPLEEIGPYKLIRSLGKGGMGEVFLASQEAPIVRQVAVKILKDTLRGRAAHRFDLERRSLARMSHPHIAQIFDAGETADGRPYLVMELVDGLSIDDYCNQNELTLNQRLELFAGVCDGIHHAHQKSVLHRDVKPPNILVADVDGKPVPKIIDFGIAKALGDEVDTQDQYVTKVGAVVGTPAYLSPEAVAGSGGGDVDIRTDVYGLGVVLYGLIVGRLPFSGLSSNWLELLRRTSEEDAPAPSVLYRKMSEEKKWTVAEQRGVGTSKAFLRHLQGDLDAVLLKAVARDRNHRYGSAAELAADIRRYLNHQPVEAGPYSRRYRAIKFVRRHRAEVAAAILVMLSLVGGIIARTLEAHRADKAALEAMQARGETEKVVEFMVDLFEVADPSQSLGKTITANELLDRGALRLRHELQDQPLSRARLLDTVGLVYQNLGLYEKAEELLNESLDTREGHGADALEVADSLANIGVLHWKRVENEEAETYLRRSLEIRQARLGPGDPKVAELLDRLGMVATQRADFEEADQLLTQALEIRENVYGERSEPVANTLNHLAITLLDQGRVEESEEVSRRVLEIRESLLGPKHPDVARTLNGLALAIDRQDKFEEAEVYHRRALEIRQEVLGPNHTEVAQSMNNLGGMLMELDRPEEATAMIKGAVDIWRQNLGDDNALTSIGIYNLADLLANQEKFAEAEPLLRRVRDIFIEQRGPDHPHTAFASRRLGDVMKETNRLDEAEKLYREAFEIRRAKMPSDHPQLIGTARMLADLLRSRGDAAGAEALEALYPEPEDEQQSESEPEKEQDSTDGGQ